MKDFLKVVGLLIVIAGSLVAIFWSKGYYGILPVEQGKSCGGFIASAYMVSHNFPSAKISLAIADRTFIYSIDNSVPVSYCVGFRE